MAIRMNFTLPKDLVDSLRAEVGDRGRSAFVAEAVRLRLATLKREQLDAEMEEGYKARYAEDQALARELDGVSGDGLDDQ